MTDENDYPDPGALFPQPDRPIERERIVLDWRRYAQVQAVSQAWLEDARLTVLQDQLFPQMVLRLERDILADKRAEQTYQAHLDIPRSPWHHWRHKHRNAWWLRWLNPHRPVQYDRRTATLEVERWQHYPDARLPAERFGRPVVFEQIRGPWWEDQT